MKTQNVSKCFRLALVLVSGALFSCGSVNAPTLDVSAVGRFSQDSDVLEISGDLRNDGTSILCVFALSAFPSSKTDKTGILGFSERETQPYFPIREGLPSSIQLLPSESLAFRGVFDVLPVPASDIPVEGGASIEEVGEINNRIRLEMTQGVYRAVLEVHAKECSENNLVENDGDKVLVWLDDLSGRKKVFLEFGSIKVGR